MYESMSQWNRSRPWLVTNGPQRSVRSSVPEIRFRSPRGEGGGTPGLFIDPRCTTSDRPVRFIAYMAAHGSTNADFFRAVTKAHCGPCTCAGFTSWSVIRLAKGTLPDHHMPKKKATLSAYVFHPRLSFGTSRDGPQPMIAELIFPESYPPNEHDRSSQ